MPLRVNISPIAFAFGGFDFRWYGLLFLAAFLLGFFALFLLEREKKLEPGLALDLTLGLALAGLLGARAGYIVFARLAFQDWPRFDLGGLSFYPGLLVAFFFGREFLKRRGLDWRTVADRLALVLPFSISLVRIGNFLNQELLGRASEVPLAVIFPTDNVARHPHQLYEALLALGLGLWLIFQAKKNRAANFRLAQGSLFALFLIFQGASRFLVEFFRQPEIVLYLTGGQWLALASLLCGLWLYRGQRTIIRAKKVI